MQGYRHCSSADEIRGWRSSEKITSLPKSWMSCWDREQTSQGASRNGFALRPGRGGGGSGGWVGPPPPCNMEPLLEILVGADRKCCGYVILTEFATLKLADVRNAISKQKCITDDFLFLHPVSAISFSKEPESMVPLSFCLLQPENTSI